MVALIREGQSAERAPVLHAAGKGAVKVGLPVPGTAKAPAAAAGV